MDPDGSAASSETSYVRSRIANACDGCKARKVKCDGQLPCSYCARRQRPHACHYSPQRRRQRLSQGQTRAEAEQDAGPDAIGRLRATGRLPRSPPPSARASRGRSTRDVSPKTPVANASSQAQGTVAASSGVDASPEDDTDVPREARLLCDAQGKLTFIGDCAPLSFFQSVRQLVTNRLGQNAFAPHTSRFSVLENAPARRANHPAGNEAPGVEPLHVAQAISAYLSTTTGLVDLFDDTKLLDDLLLWANLSRKTDDLTTVVNYLVLAIGHQMYDEELSQAYFEYARHQAYTHLSGDLSVETVQAFVLLTIYMLCSCQINEAFLFFGISVRAAYSIGVHRTEVNARFGPDIHRQRDRLWKSLRAVDLFLSSSMGRPPATSDVDCTVPYRQADSEGHEAFDLLNASVQILLILERVVVEIYSRKKVSLQLTEGISLQLREWSAKWLRQLKDVIYAPGASNPAQASGACQVLSSYYYAVMLVSRPFLMYELIRRLSEGPSAASRQSLTSGKSKLADACIDAASLMVDPVLDLIGRGCLDGRRPLLVSWLFASSLVLGVGLLGGFGRVLEKYARMSIEALEHFAKSDAHATQYSLIAQSLLTTALEHLERREMQERLQRTESSSQLFGLIPNETHSRTSTPASRSTLLSHAPSPAVPGIRDREYLERSFSQRQGLQGASSPHMGDIDSAFLGLDESLLQTPDVNYWTSTLGNDGDSGSALNLFPLLDAGGGIDLAHYL